MAEFLLVVFTALVVFFATVFLTAPERKRLIRELAEERERVADLHNRLAARTYQEYAGWNVAVPQAEEPAGRTLRDATGLIEVEADDDDDT